jgi:hypothetical protein
LNNGDVVECTWKNGVANGKGVFKYANGDVFECTWKNGKANGKGFMIYASGSVYECIGRMGWLTAKECGKVQMEPFLNVFGRTGMLTANEFEIECDGCLGRKPNGRGVKKLANGDVIEGEWKNGKLQSHALFKSADGDVSIMKASSVVDVGSD